MTVKNSLQTQAQSSSFSSFMAMPAVKQKVNEIVGGRKGDQFITSIITAVSTNPGLQSCDYQTILSAAMLGSALELSPSPQLGHFYMVPYRDNKGNRMVAQFQLGYKGYIQLATRSGQYRYLNVTSIKAGELNRWDELREEIDYTLMDDWEARENAETIGYYAYFELMNGFRKAMFWSKSRMLAHAKRYSKGYAKDLEKGWTSTFWSKDFDGMAHKTMLRQLISKWGVMSVEFQSAFASDMGVVHDDGQVEYIDNIDGQGDMETIVVEPVASEPEAPITQPKTQEPFITQEPREEPRLFDEAPEMPDFFEL